MYSHRGWKSWRNAASCHLLSLLSPTHSRADIFLPIHCSIKQKEKGGGLIPEVFCLSYCPGSSSGVREMQVPQNLHFPKHKLQRKSPCQNRWSLLLSSHQLPLYLPSSLSISSSSAQHHRDLGEAGSENMQKWSNGTNAQDRDGEVWGYHSLLLGLELGKLSCVSVIAP